MKLTLKKDWDSNVSSPTEDKKSGYFAGRANELTIFKNEISRKTKGSILISGYRGVGKTSLVYKSLSELKDDTLVILLNAAQLEAEKDEKASKKIQPKNIIENLIRRLYSASQNAKRNIGDLKNDIERLYKKAVARDCSILESYQKEQQLKNQTIIADEFKLAFNYQTVIYSIGWIFSLSSFVLTLNANSVLLKLIPLFFAYPIPFLADVTVKHIRSKEKIEIKETKIEAKELYAFDNSIGNLEYDLEQIHRGFKQRKLKLIYVIDELDKLDADQVIEVLKFFKNLFTLSDAIFIFVGGEEIYDYHTSEEKNAKGSKEDEDEEKPKLYRPKEYTFFTSRYFLSRPLWEDLDEYFDEIIETKKTEIDTKELEKIKRSIAFEAKNDFFDLKTKIKDRIKNFERNDNAIIESEASDSTKANLHKAISVLFKKYMLYKPSAWIENESIQRELFKHSDMLLSKNIAEKIIDPNDDSNISAAIRDFNQFLHRLKMLKYETETLVLVRGINIPIKTYSIIGEITIEPPENLNAPTEFENRFITEFEKFCKYVFNISNSLVSDFRIEKIDFAEFWREADKHVKKVTNWGHDVETTYTQYIKIYQGLRLKAHQDKYRREDIEKYIEALIELNNELINALPSIFGKLLAEWNSNLTFRKLSENGNLFGGTASKIREKFLPDNPVVIVNADNSRQILLTENRIDLIKEHEQLIKDCHVTNKIISFTPEHQLNEFHGYNSVLTSDSEKLRINLITMLRYIDGFLKFKPKEEKIEDKKEEKTDKE